ncbi:MAG: VWA domain-containing protein [Acidobacteriia bacterium]|nr:VWA domain-containing protein [Terriglobia bacterium]
MRFADPWVLALLLLVPAGGAIAAFFAVLRRKALVRFAGGVPQAARFLDQVSPHRRAIRVLLLLLGAAAGILAAARPQWGTRLEPVTRKGVDVVVAVDTSLSMAAQDAPPDRLRQAKHAADALVRRLAGNRVGLVTFAGKATIACPLTLDSDAVRLFLDAVDVNSVSFRGTGIAKAAEVAVRAFGAGPPSSKEVRGRALVLFSDGEDHEGGIEDAAKALERSGVRVFAVGCGTRRGAPVPEGGEGGGSSSYKKDREGKLVTSRLSDETLGKLTLATGGRYFDATPSEAEVEEIAKAISAMDAREFGTLMRARYEERFQIPLALAFAALLAGTLLPDRRRVAGAWWRRAREERT